VGCKKLRADQIQEHLFDPVVITVHLCLINFNKIQFYLFASQYMHLLDHFKQNVVQSILTRSSGIMPTLLDSTTKDHPPFVSGDPPPLQYPTGILHPVQTCG
jgi:hypothetical protein